MKISKLILFFSLFFCFCLSATAEDTASDDSTGQDDTRVYHVYDDVDLVSTLKFRYGLKPKTFVKYVFPELQSDNENTGVTYFNELVSEFIEQQISEFRKQVVQNQGFQKNLDAEKVKNNLYIDYDTSLIQSTNDHLISIRFSMQGFVGGLARPYHYHRVLNFNLDTGETIDLSDLFKPNADYLSVLSQYASQALAQRFPDSKLVAQGTAPTFVNYRNWNMKPNGLLITFDDEQVAPANQGAQTVLIPYSVLKTILSSDSPLAGCVKNKRRCARTNVLTGGFIDEALNTPHGVLNPMLSSI